MSEGKLFIKDSRTCKSYEITISQNTVNAIDLNKINAPTGKSDPAHRVEDGLRLLDPGYHHTASHTSSITWIDGAKGVLLFRGHSWEELQEKSFEDMLYLLVWGALPSAAQKEKLRREIAEVACSVPSIVSHIIKSFPRESPAMTMILAGISAYMSSEPSIMPAYNAGSTYHRQSKLVDTAIVQTVAVYSVVVGLAYSYRKDIEFTPPSRSANFYENLLTMIGTVDGTGKPSKLHYDCFKSVGSIAADHELTNSTFALLVSASSLTDPMSCIMSALCSGYGPLHMGACESAYKMMQKLGGPHNAPQIIHAVKSGTHRLYGYGHRMYRVPDPRIARMKSLIDALDAGSPARDPVLATALEIDRLASQDEYFTSRNLHANVDLYAVFFGIAMGFPVDFLPVMMVMVRLPGYMAHWRESMHRDIKLMRPAAIYSGPTEPVKQQSMGHGEAFFKMDGEAIPEMNKEVVSKADVEVIAPIA